MPQIDFGKYDKPTLLCTAQDVTSGWVACGSEMDLRNFNRLALLAAVDIDGSNNVQFRLLLSPTAGASATGFAPALIANVSNVATTAADYIEVGTDVDQSICILFPEFPGGMYGTVQVKAGTVGGDAADVTVQAFGCTL